MWKFHAMSRNLVATDSGDRAHLEVQGCKVLRALDLKVILVRRELLVLLAILVPKVKQDLAQLDLRGLRE
jgi:hypothetical protein